MMKYVFLTLFVMLLGGCSGMESLKHGKLSAMQSVLNEASANCVDEGSRTRAINWAVLGIKDLTESNDYQERGSEQYKSAKNLISHLTLLASRRNNNIDIVCRNISSAALATTHYLEGDGGQELASVAKN